MKSFINYAAKKLTARQYCLLASEAYTHEEILRITANSLDDLVEFWKKEDARKSYEQKPTARQREFFLTHEYNMEYFEQITRADARKEIINCLLESRENEVFLERHKVVAKDNAPKGPPPAPEAYRSESVPKREITSEMQDEADSIAEAYKSAYVEEFGSEPKDLALARSMIRTYLRDHEVSADVLTRVIRYYFIAYDSTDKSGKQWGKSIDRLLSDKQQHAFIFEACIQNSKGFNYELFRTAKKNGKTMKETQVAIKRGEVAVESSGVNASKLQDDICGRILSFCDEQNYSNAEGREFRKHLKFANLFNSAGCDFDYIQHAEAHFAKCVAAVSEAV